MKYYKLFAAINPLEKNTYYMVYDTVHMSHAPELGLKCVQKEAKRYIDACIDCYIRGFDEFAVQFNSPLAAL